MPVSPISSLMLDKAGGSVEFDIEPPSSEAQDPMSWSVGSKIGPIDERCRQTKPMRVLSCLGHLHIGEHF